MRILSLDIGYKNTGISISSVDRKSILPLKALRLEKFDGRIFFNSLKTHLKEYWESIDTVIIGNPEDSEFENDICRYAKQVERIFKAWTTWKVFFISETNSTQDSLLLLKKLNYPKKKIENYSDSYAALILLNDFLDLNKEKNIVIF